jgi:hypothetical protein
MVDAPLLAEAEALRPMTRPVPPPKSNLPGSKRPGVTPSPPPALISSLPSFKTLFASASLPLVSHGSPCTGRPRSPVWMVLDQLGAATWRRSRRLTPRPSCRRHTGCNSSGSDRVDARARAANRSRGCSTIQPETCPSPFRHCLGVRGTATGRSGLLRIISTDC